MAVLRRRQENGNPSVAVVSAQELDVLEAKAERLREERDLLAIERAGLLAEVAALRRRLGKTLDA